MQPDIEQLKQQIVPLLKEVGAMRSALFGSTARGEATEKSDVDILVELPDHLTLLDVIGLKLKLEDKLSRKVDLVEYSAIKPAFKESILEDTIEIL